MERSYTQTTYEIDGKTYMKLEDIPQPHRDMIEKMLEDNNHDGIPDLMQDAGPIIVNTTTLRTSTTTHILDDENREMFSSSGNAEHPLDVFSDTNRIVPGSITNLNFTSALLITIVVLLVVVAIMAIVLFA